MADQVWQLHQDIERQVRELASSQARFQSLIAHNADGMMIIDRQGLIRFLNPAAETLLDRPARDLVGQPFGFPVVAGETSELDIVRRNGQATIAEMRVTATEWDGQPAYLASLRDITEHKRLQTELERYNRSLDLINRVGQTLTATLDLDQVIEQLTRAISQTIHAEGGSVWLCDPAAPCELICHGSAYPGLKRTLINLRLAPGEGIAGWVVQHVALAIVNDVSRDPRFSPRIDQLVGMHTRSVLAVPLTARERVLGVLEAVNKTQGQFDTHDAELVTTLARSAAIAIENAQLVETLQQQAGELQARNQELDAFAHTVAHDLKTPLNLIIGYADLLKEDLAPQLDTQQRVYVDMVIRNGRRMDSIIEALLLLAQMRHVQIETHPLDMDVIVSEVRERLAAVIAQRKAEILLPPAWPRAAGYAPWVAEVWANYMSNAIKYGGQPPRLELGATPLTSPPQAGGREGGMVNFWVHDNGPGLTSEQQSRLFAPFTRLHHNLPGGHGLGLSIVKRIVERLGGQVGVASQPGQGSTFSFTLPVASA